MTLRLSASAAAIALSGGPLAAQDLITRDRVGLPDAPNAMSFRLTAYDLYSSDPEMRAAFEALFTEFIEARPDWRIETQLATDNIGEEQARMLEQARAGRGPDCAMIDSSQLATFKAAGVLSPMTEHWSAEEIDDLFPFVREAVTDEAGNLVAWWWFTDLRVLYRDTTVVPEAPQTWEELEAAAVGASEAGLEGLLFNGARWEGTTFDWLGNFWAAGGQLVDEEWRAPETSLGEARTVGAPLEALGTYTCPCPENGLARGPGLLTDRNQPINRRPVPTPRTAAAGTCRELSSRGGGPNAIPRPQASRNTVGGRLRTGATPALRAYRGPNQGQEERAATGTGTAVWTHRATWRGLEDRPRRGAASCGRMVKAIFPARGNGVQGPCHHLPMAQYRGLRTLFEGALLYALRPGVVYGLYAFPVFSVDSIPEIPNQNPTLWADGNSLFSVRLRPRLRGRGPRTRTRGPQARRPGSGL